MKRLFAVVGMLSIVPAHALADQIRCDDIRWRKGNVISVDSALYIGTRIQFPSNLMADVANSNPDLWNVTGAANQVLVKPNSDAPQGASTLLHVYTEDGSAYDVMVNRSSKSNSDLCVTIDNDSNEMSNGLRSALNTYASGQYAGSAQYQEQQAQNKQEKKDSVRQALRRYRYHIYTRYNWDQGSGFAGKNVISDVYDDGRWTYIRVSRNNRGLFSVTAKVEGKEAIVPSQYDDAYGVYQISGIYPEFELKLNDSRVHVTREDNNTDGES